MALTDLFVKAGESTKTLFKKVSVFGNKTKVDEVINAVVPVDAFGSEIDFAKNTTLTSGDQKTQVTASALPTGAATEATLVQIRDAIKNQINIASSIWTDDSGEYYIRTIESDEGAETVVYTTPDGNAATPGTGLRPLSTADRDIIQEVYDAIDAGTGFVSGDILSRAVIYNADKNTATALWFNLTQGAVLSTNPTSAQVERANEKVLVSSAAGALALDATVAATNTSLGTDGPTPPTISGTGVRGWLRGIYELIFARLPATLGQKTGAGSLSVILASDQPSLSTNVAQLGGVAVDATGIASKDSQAFENAGRRFNAAINPTPLTGVAITAANQSSYVQTAPNILIVAGAKPVTVKEIFLKAVGIGTGVTSLQVVGIMDSVARYTSGGTLRAAKNNALADSTATIRVGTVAIVAAAPSASARTVFNPVAISAVPALNTQYKMVFGEPAMASGINQFVTSLPACTIPAGGSLAIHLIGTGMTVAPTFDGTIVIEE